MTEYFVYLKAKDKNNLKQVIVKEDKYKKLQKNSSTPDKRSYKESIENTQAEFEKVVSNAEKIGVNWMNVVLDSVAFVAKTENKYQLVNGKIYFRLKDNSAFYFINIINLSFFENELYFSKQYSPAENAGPKNRFLTKDLKEEYINVLSQLMHLSREWAEGQYYRDTEMSNGAEIVKDKIAFCKKELAKKKK